MRNFLKSYAKINLALNIVGKTSSLHKIESIVAFVSLYDQIFIKRIKSDHHNISFIGKFSQNIGRNNTISKLLEILENKKLLKNTKFAIKIKKNIPNKAGLGGGSMNAATILKYFIKKKIIKISKRDTREISKLVGSDVILGLNFKNSVLNSKNEIIHFSNYKKIYTLIVKPDFGCSTKQIYSKIKKFNKPEFNKPSKKMFDLEFLKKKDNSLEKIALNNYPRLRTIKSFLENISGTAFVRMTGSGSAFVTYFNSKKRCDNAKREFNRRYRNYWCISSKTI